MIRKTWFALFMLIGIVLFASCNPAQISLTAQANMSNPASLYCEQQGNKLEIVTASDGSQNGVCVFPDGSTCDEWAYFYNECGPAEQSGSLSASTEIPTTTQEIDSQFTSSIPLSGNATVTVPAQVVTNEPLGYCFAYPQGFTQQINDSQVEVIGPHSDSGSKPGLVWIDATDARGRTAQEVANEDVNAFGGSPPRSTVMMGGEEALVLDGMPGQDAIRKVYIVHNGLLYTLSFSPYQSDNDIANAQMETLFVSVTSSWVWMSTGKSCPATVSSAILTKTPSQVAPSPTYMSNTCSASWFFTFDDSHLTLASYCPEPVKLLEAIGQDFEGGRAYRYAPDPSYTIDQRGTIFIIYNDGEWITIPDNWDSSQPSSDPNLVVPEGRYQPIDSIGKIWRENVLYVRDRLGWAYEPQSKFQGRIQHYLVQPGVPSGDTHFFFIDHGKWGIVLMLNSIDMGPNKWEVVGTYQ